MDYKKTPSKIEYEKLELKNKGKNNIAIITPFYNSGETIMETSYTVLNQTYPFFDWLIIDDGSTDKKSLKVLKELETKDKRIKVFHKENGGPSLARDFGIDKTSEDIKYIFFLDSDDLLNKTALECLYWSLETHPEASFAYSSIVNFGDEEFIWEKYLTVAAEKKENLISVSSMIKKEDIISVGKFGIKEKAMYEDWNLWLKLLAAGKIPLRVSAPLFWYRKSSSGELSRAKTNNENAMKYVNETKEKIKKDVEIIQFPRAGKKYATIKKCDFQVPNYKKTKKKNILYIFPWMVVGGADFFNLELIKRLNKDKYNSIILTTTPSDNPIRQDFEEHADVYDMSSFLERSDYLNFVDYIIKSRNIDIIFISNSEYGYYMAPYLNKNYPNIPIIDYIHCIDIHDKRNGFLRCSEDVKPYIYHTYCCNNYTLGQLKNDFNVTNSDTIYIGTDEEKFNPKKYNKELLKEKYNIPKNKIIISFVARLADQKRPEMFVEIAKRIHKLNDNTVFVVAGDGPLMPNVLKLIDGNFIMLGMINKPEEIYSVSDITINCSSFEGLALTSYESLSMGVPVISTDAGGQKELIDETVGAIIHFNEHPTKEEFDNEINEYVNETIRVINNLESIKVNCRNKIVNKFTLNHMAKQFEKIFDESIKNKKEVSISDGIMEYELAIEAYYPNYYFYTKDYLENKFGYNFNETNERKLYLLNIKNKIYAFCKRKKCIKEAKNILNLMYQTYKLTFGLIKNIIYFIKFFILSIYSAFIILIKILGGKNE